MPCRPSLNAPAVIRVAHDTSTVNGDVGVASVQVSANATVTGSRDLHVHARTTQAGAEATTTRRAGGHPPGPPVMMTLALAWAVISRLMDHLWTGRRRSSTAFRPGVAPASDTSLTAYNGLRRVGSA